MEIVQPGYCRPFPRFSTSVVKPNRKVTPLLQEVEGWRGRIREMNVGIIFGKPAGIHATCHGRMWLSCRFEEELFQWKRPRRLEEIEGGQASNERMGGRRAMGADSSPPTFLILARLRRSLFLCPD